MKTLRIDLADILDDIGAPSGSTATATVQYVDTNGVSRDLHLVDGTIVVSVPRQLPAFSEAGVVDVEVYETDDVLVREVDHGHLLKVRWVITTPDGAKHGNTGTRNSRRVAITSDLPDPVSLASLSTPTPVPPYTGGYVLPAELDALDDRVVVLEAGGGGGGGGVTVHNLLTGRSTADAHPTSAITGLDAALAAAATDADLTAHAADTTGVHGIADTAALVLTSDARLSDARTPTTHTHDDRYFTETEADGRFVRTVNGTGPDGSGNVTVAGGGGGVTDHGALTGLGDDDHTLYALADGTRGTFAAPLGADDNYVTDAEKVKLSNLSGTNTGDQTLPTWTTIAGKPAVVAAGIDAAAARTAIGAGTSSIVVGTGAGDAKAGNYQPTAANISDSTTTGRAVLTAVDAAAARTTLALGTAATTASTAYATAAQGTKADTAVQPARTITAGTGLTGGGDLSANRTLTVAYGTTSTTATVGNDSRVTGAAQKSANLSDLTNASTARTNLGLGTAATTAATAYATAAQGATADAALAASAAPELIRDTMAAALVAGANVTITPNDGADTITIAAAGGGGGGGAPDTAAGEDVLILGTEGDPSGQNTSILFLGMVIIPVDLTFTTIGCEVTTNVAASTVSLCICTRSGATLTKVFESSALDSSTTGVKTETGLSQFLAAGVYWVGSMSVGGTPAVKGMAAPTGQWAFPHFGGITNSLQRFVYVAPEAPPFASTMTIGDGSSLSPALVRLGGVTY